ncbi:MAG TPA: hypothetical protein VEY50_12165 [Lysobacter sp.]|nr:hypothetical protein [Lysobacter sp.]
MTRLYYCVSKVERHWEVHADGDSLRFSYNSRDGAIDAARAAALRAFNRGTSSGVRVEIGGRWWDEARFGRETHAPR